MADGNSAGIPINLAKNACHYNAMRYIMPYDHQFCRLSFFTSVHPPELLIFQEHSPTPFSKPFTHLG
jgi:hypothetical protein